MSDMTPRSRRWLHIAGALGVLLIAGCGREHAPAQDSGAPTAQRATADYIKVEPVTAEGAGLHGTLPGRVAFRPDAMAGVGTPFTGRVVSIEVRPGQAVKAGAPLAVLQSVEAADARTGLQQAQTKLSVAQDALRRQNDMMERGVGLEVERYAAEVALREAQAEAGRARQWSALAGPGAGDRLVLRAPTEGVVLAVHAQAGAMVSAGADALVDVGDPSRLWVVADVPERELSGLAVGRSARVRVQGVDANLAMKVVGIGHVVDAEQRRLPIYLDFQDRQPESGLAAGMFAQVQVEGIETAALTLPATAVLIKEGTQRQVYLKGADGRYEARQVRTGVSRAGRVEILEGLDVGDQVVVQGALLLDNEAGQLL